MSDDRNTPSGASSDDTTSALFVSARKKQLQQQEAERLAQEKEAQRLAAEAEVQRLEREVEERRRQAEEEARRIEYENAEKKRLAEEEARRAESENAMRRQQAEAEARRIDKEVMAKQTQAAKTSQEPQLMHVGISPSPYPAKKTKPILFAAIGAAVVVIAIVLIVIFSSGDKRGNANDDGSQISTDPVITSTSPSETPHQSPNDDTRQAEYEIYGSYYMLDEHDMVLFDRVIFFDSDMTVRIGDGPEWYDFEISDYTLEIQMGGYPTQFLIIDEDTLYSFEDDAHFIRNLANYESAPDPYTLWEIDPDARLDETVVISSLNLGVLFPSDIFYISQNTDEYLELVTHDPNGGFIAISKLAPFDNSDNRPASVIAPQVNGLGEGTIRTYFASTGNYSIIEEYPLSPTSSGGTTIRYSAVISSEAGGVPV